MNTTLSPDAAPADAPEATGRRARWATLLLGLCMFSTGASGLVSEYILATVSTYILGNSIEQFSVIIGLMLFMMGVASWVQKFVGDRGLVEKFLATEILLALLGSIAPIAIYAAYGYFTTHFALVQYVFVMSIGFLIGFEIPLVLRINERYSDQLRANLATIFSFDYLGGLAGALVWTFVLLRLFPLTEISVIVAGSNFLVAAATYLLFRRWGIARRRTVPLLAVVATLAVLTVIYARNREWNLQLEQQLYDDPIVLSETTRYQHLVLTHDPTLDEHRLYINGNTQFSSRDEEIYHEQLVHPVLNLASSRERVLILGGGDGLALREVLKYPDVSEVTLVDLDPRMIELATTHPLLRELNDDAFHDARAATPPPDGVEAAGSRPVFVATGAADERGRAATKRVATVRVRTMDAERFVRGIRGRYDVVIIDLPDPNSVEIAKLYSREFYRMLRGRVAPGGMVALQATSPYHAKAAFLCIRRTLEAAGFATLPYHDNVPSFGEWGWILAWDPERFGGRVRDRIARLDGFPVDLRYLTPDVFRAALVFGAGALEPTEENRGSVNTMMHPELLHLYLEESWKTG